jgi:hypothetical protein
VLSRPIIILSPDERNIFGTKGLFSRSPATEPFEPCKGEQALQSQFEEDAFAEVTATSMAIVKAIGGLSSLAIDSGPYLSGVLEAGLHDLDEMDYQNIAGERRAAFRDKVKLHYADLIATISK